MFGERIAEQRKKLGLSQEELAEKVRIFLKQQRENCMRKQEPLILR